MTDARRQIRWYDCRSRSQGDNEDMKREGLLVKQEDLDQNIGTCWRCHTPIEFLRFPVVHTERPVPGQSPRDDRPD